MTSAETRPARTTTVRSGDGTVIAYHSMGEGPGRVDGERDRVCTPGGGDHAGLVSVLRIAIRGQKWATMDRLLEANLVEHRLQPELDAPSPERFSTVSARTVLLGGTKSPDSMSGPLLDEIAAASTVLGGGPVSEAGAPRSPGAG